MNATTSYQAIITSPIGPLGIVIEEGVLYRINFLSDETTLQAAEGKPAAQVAAQLQHYFKQADWHFSLPLQPMGTTFQQQVWQQLRQIPLGEVRTYGEIARALNSGPRAVGNACRNNPLPVVVPCHRVVAANGPGGFAGQTQGRNLSIKGWLLAHERATL
ncbi:MAG: methylated-DNA--[protein]-cysteine S-methyltransferase [Candidatus Polarisedimenticolaceae bacterium]|nr:methylated-DNA--[protein]-cysteine S-methyltransferase [Candidatus Polarisedimenticolaceae bacterium]